MKIELNLEEFVKFITYDYLHDSVVIPDSFVEAIERAINDASTEEHLHPPCVVEGNVLWPMHSWINEWKRRREAEKLLLNFSEIKTEPIIHDKKQLQQLLIKATIKGDVEEIKRISEQMK